MKKHLKLVIFLITAILVVLIYKTTFRNQVVYLALGDSLAKGVTPFNEEGTSYTDYVANYLRNNHRLSLFDKSLTNRNYRVTDLIDDMNDNILTKVKGKEISINQLIAKADIITISIGFEEINYKINSVNITKLDNINSLYKYVDEIFRDYEDVLKYIRRITNKPIILIGYYNPELQINSSRYKKIEKLFSYIEMKFRALSNTKHIYYVGIYDGFKEKSYYTPNKENYHPSLEGYNFIANKIIEVIKKEKLL